MDPYTERLETAVAQYLGSHVLKRIQNRPNDFLENTWETMEASILFIDIRSFTKLVASHSGPGLLQDLNLYLERVSEVVARNNGFVDSIIGDAVLAVFGLEGPEHPSDACRAALGCLDVLPSINRDKQATPDFEIGIGLNSGQVSLGNIGSQYKRKLSVTGQAVNLAARLESLTSRYQSSVLISEHTQRELGAEFKTEKKDEVAVKGFSGLLSIFELLPTDREAP